MTKIVRCAADKVRMFAANVRRHRQVSTKGPFVWPFVTGPLLCSYYQPRSLFKDRGYFGTSGQRTQQKVRPLRGPSRDFQVPYFP